MQLLELTLPTPAENVALDDALLEQAERGEAAADVLRLWESPSRLVVVGRSSRIEQERTAMCSGDWPPPCGRWFPAWRAAAPAIWRSAS
jgi:hypothetical protein